MISAFLPFVFSVVTGVTPAPAPAPAAAPEPAVRVTINHQTYNRGDRARVTVRVRDDGYVVVLHADANGRVRVLFPVDPGDDNFMKGGQDYEIRGRGDRDAFQVTSTGSGTVYAAVSMDPMHFDSFVRNSHWDYEALENDSTASNDGDVESQLTNIVEQVADGSHFDYDLTTYTVDQSYASNDRPYAIPGAAYTCFYDSWDPWCGGYYPSPNYYGGFGLDIGFGFGGFWGYRPYGYGYGYPRYGFGYGYGFGGGYYIPRGYGAAGYGYKVGRGWSYNHRPIILGPGGGYTVGRGFGLGSSTIGYHNRGTSLVSARGGASPLYGVSRFNTQRGSSRGIESPNRYGRREVSTGDRSGFRTRINDRPASAVGGTRVSPREEGRLGGAPERVQPRGEARATRVEPRGGETRSQPRAERAPQHESRGGGGGGGEHHGGGGGGGGGHHGGGGGGGGRRH